MRSFVLFLRLAAPVFFIVGTLHLVLGLGADVMLGAKVPATVMADPGLDSQNRFYAISFTLYGVLFLLFATDVRKYATVLRCVLWVFFAAGAARFVSIALHGSPPPMIWFLLLAEVIPPPLLVWWLSRVSRPTAAT